MSGSDMEIYDECVIEINDTTSLSKHTIVSGKIK
jgi:hypothetical protein